MQSDPIKGKKNRILGQYEQRRRQIVEKFSLDTPLVGWSMRRSVGRLVSAYNGVQIAFQAKVY